MRHPSRGPRDRVAGPSDDPHQRLRDYMHKRRRFNSSQESYDQFEAYLATDPIARDDSFNPIAYWIGRQRSTAQLAKFALDSLAIPSMSDDTERSFSAGRDLITYHRNRLSADIVEATQCLSNWYRPPVKSEQPEAYSTSN